MKKSINELIQAHQDIWELLKTYGLEDFSDPDAFFDIFYDENIHFEYILAFRKLTSAMNLVFPSKEALDFWQDYQDFVAVNALATRHLRDQRLNIKIILMA